MKRTINKITSILMVLILVVISYSNPVKAATINYVEGTFRYVLYVETHTAEIHDNLGNRSSGDIIIPEKITYNNDEYIVTSLGRDAFYHSELITSVVMPDTITTLGVSIFSDNINLESVTFSKNLTKIPHYSFSKTALKSIDIPEGVTHIEYNAFGNNKQLEQIKLPSTLISLDGAFDSCTAVEQITLPPSLKVISTQAFKDTQLTSINLPKGLEVIGYSTFTNNLISDLEIPDSVNTLEPGAFENNKINKLKISNSLTQIRYETFKDNLLENLIISPNVTEINYSAFENNKIKNITFLNSNVVLDQYKSPFFNNPIENIFVKKESDIDILLRSENITNGFNGVTKNIIDIYSLENTNSKYMNDTKLLNNINQGSDLEISTDITNTAIKAFDVSTKSFVPSTSDPIIIDDATIEWYKESTGLNKASDTLVGTGKDLTLSNVNANDRGSYYALINGVLKLESIKVNVKINSSVKVNYLDEQGKSISPSTTINGLSSEPYTTTSIKIFGYTLKTTPTNFEGIIEDTQIVVDYIYTKDKVEVTTKPDIVDNTDKDKLPTSGSPAIVMLSSILIFSLGSITLMRKWNKTF